MFQLSGFYSIRNRKNLVEVWAWSLEFFQAYLTWTPKVCRKIAFYRFWAIILSTLGGLGISRTDNEELSSAARDESRDPSPPWRLRVMSLLFL